MAAPDPGETALSMAVRLNDAQVGWLLVVMYYYQATKVAAAVCHGSWLEVCSGCLAQPQVPLFRVVQPDSGETALSMAARLGDAQVGRLRAMQCVGVCVFV